MKITLAALLGMVACTSAAAVSKEDQATMIKTKILTGMNTTEVYVPSCCCAATGHSCYTCHWYEANCYGCATSCKCC